MKKFYIPTTTLNFNNILSSESISPKSFYKERDFGYSTWFSVAENNLNNSIVLYDRKIFFECPPSDYEDHPLLIELQLNEATYGKFTKQQDVYTCDFTLYLTPLTCNFVFFSEVDMQTTLSMSESSLETKLVYLYSNHLLVIKPQERHKVITINDTQHINYKKIKEDVRINKMKGLLYGYYIGSILSSSKSIVQKLKTLRDIHNIFAAILASFDKTPTKQQEDNLNKLFYQLKLDDPLYKEIYDIIDDINKYNQIVLLLESRGVLRNNLNVKHYLNTLAQSKYDYEKKNEDNTENRAITWIKGAIHDHERFIEQSKKPLNTLDEEIIITENQLIKIKNSELNEDIECTLFKVLINNVFSSAEYNGKVNSFKDKISDKITIKAKEVYQEKWEDSHTKEILNKLRRHVRGDVFEIAWNNGLLSSISAVITNGGNWTKLLTFMQNKGMNDYKLAFAIYGALNGFANLTRDFTDILYQCPSTYVKDIYMEFHGQLFSEDINFPTSNFPSPLSKDNTSKVEYTEEFENLFEKITKKCKGAEKDKEIYYDYYAKYGLTDDFKQAIESEKKINNGKKVQKGVLDVLKNLLHPSKLQRKISNSNSLIPSLFEQTKEPNSLIGNISKKRLLINDVDHAWNLIETIIPHNNLQYNYTENGRKTVKTAKEAIRADLIWLCKTLQMPKQKRWLDAYKKVEESDNMQVIDKFFSLKRPYKEKKGAEYYSEELREKIRAKLIQYYC